MTDQPRPAWAKESIVLKIDEIPDVGVITPEWAWGGADGQGVRVAVIDSGIEADHPRVGRAVDASGAVAFTVDPEGQVEEVPGPHDDSFGHGTACAGIIHHLAPSASLTSVKVLGAGNTGKSQAFIAGLSWAIDQGFDVINLSLGTKKRDWALAFYELCDRAYFENSFVVTAANNVQRRSYPSLYASVTSVACNTTADPFRFHFNPEPPTEFLARGIDVDVAWKDGGAIQATGNSFAAPHIAGLAALIRSKHPQLRPFQVKSVLWATAANVRESSPLEAAGRVTRAMGRATGRLHSTRATAMLRLTDDGAS